ncbi:VWA domain-containing protein [Seonamhaeicola sediminis]|uniref:VWA domain-containing protein n=1 Tax=Seonamhaeicola sediminis TaxID=2528206 RepID=A0A562YEH4_9FLAO|nr:VWA domain-containing protein [Seonamhaeicola sediminis]TWO33025.1 VWA domain-containing protein [Seonamhaeicola sediminis]
MSTETLIYIILSGILALFIALFQYRYKSKITRFRLNALFSFLRFITIFSILLLIINPKFEQISVYTEKPNLIVAVDNSSSIKHLKKDEASVLLVDKLLSDTRLNDKFNVSTYTFGNILKSSDSLTFNETETNINNAFKQLAQVYKSSVSPTVMITDGNQTYGNDYQFSYINYKQPIYPIILGDTITYTDLKVQQLNVNKYAYLKNRFPVEAILVYSGNNNINTKLEVANGNTTIYSQSVSFSKSDNSKIINFTLPANTIGTNSYKLSLNPIENEKNTINNSKNFAIEVIDQKTKIAFVTNIWHPDIGAFKKSIESNEQRSVTVLNSDDIIGQINDYQLIIINQPNNSFKLLFEELNKQNKNRFIIIGPKTDLNFINNINDNFSHDIVLQTEDYQADFNSNFSPFQVTDIDFESFPPLTSNYGAVNLKVPYQSILTKRIGDVSINEPLLATFETNNRREAILFGENIWKWRAQSYLNTKTFNDFDNFIGKLVQYLASNRQRSRLNVDHESFYIGNNNIIINAQFFDKNYVFDDREVLNIRIKDKLSKNDIEFPFVLKNNNYQVDLSSLPPSEYSFTVKASKANLSKSGSFTVLEYDVEQQFLNANVVKLEQLATNSGGKSYFIDNTSGLINDLMNDNRYISIQKRNKNIIPLIDWKFLLAIIAFCLSAEWFLRKYNGLI